jgi:hypothetical protein
MGHLKVVQWGSGGELLARPCVAVIRAAEAVRVLGASYRGVIGADGWAPYRVSLNGERASRGMNALSFMAQMSPPSGNACVYMTSYSLESRRPTSPREPGFGKS